MAKVRLVRPEKYPGRPTKVQAAERERLKAEETEAATGPYRKIEFPNGITVVVPNRPLCVRCRQMLPKGSAVCSCGWINALPG